MKKAAYCSMCVVLLMWTAVSALQQNPVGTLIADATDVNSITFTIVDSGGDAAIPDVIVSGAESGDGTYLDIGVIVGRVGPGDTITVAVEAATSWNLTGLNGGTVTIEDYSGITFSAIDNLVGGPGDDTYVFDADGALGTVAITEFPDGGTDTLDFSSTTTRNLTVNLSDASPQIVAPTLTLDLSSGDVIENVIGGSGADTITGNSLDNTLTGGPGRDILTGGDGLDTVVETRDDNFTLSDKSLIIGIEGTDTLSGIETAYLTGGAGNNTISASSFTGPVVLDGADGNDILTGGSGDDELTGGPGEDVIHGGLGTNTVIETRDADFGLTRRDTSSTSLTIDSESDTLYQIQNIHLIGGPADNHFNISALAGDSIWLEGGIGYDTLALEPNGVDVSLITGGIIVPGLQSVSYETVEAVTIDEDAVVSADATLNAREYNLGSLIVSNDSVLTLASDVSASGFQGVKITTSGDLTINDGSLISADGQGYGGGQGPGAGATAGLIVTCGGGGGYGGQGGDGEGAAQGGATYGSAAAPTDLGSGGGYEGGAGGGAIYLVVAGTLLLDGGVVCEGSPGGYQAGGGSGGSIYLTAGTLAGAGTISADGGDGGEGGGGGGGRIAIYHDTDDTFSGVITASGGVGFEPGVAGTIYPWDMPAEDYLEQSIAAVRELAATDLTNARFGNTLIKKLEAAIASIETGLYRDALMKLQRDLLPKMDGCALTGQPNQDDWIITCEAQQKLYPLIWEAIQLLQSPH
jgi:hypothetical protein